MPEQPHYDPEFYARREPYLCYPVIAFWASDEEDAGKVLRAAEVALQAVEGVELLTGDLFEEVYRRDEKNEDVSVDLPIPPAPVHREEGKR